MSLSMAAFTIVNAWCISLFVMLPFSIEAEKQPEQRTTPGAPNKILWKRLLVGATVVALTFTLLLALVIKTGIVPVRDSY